MVLPAFCQFNSRYGTGMLSAAKKFLEIKNIAHCTRHIQFFWIYKLFHVGEIEVFLKVEIKILKWKAKTRESVIYEILICLNYE